MKTTKKDFELFVSECKKWIERFGLKGWAVYYDHADTKNDFANVLVSDGLDDRVVTLTFNTNWQDYPDRTKEEQIKKTAFHEIREIFYWRIRFIAGARYVQPEEIREEIHNLIRIDENTIFEVWK